jgi:tetratricopeptide (TPR) repeat protein
MAKSKELDTIFPLNAVLAIREPVCKMAIEAQHSYIHIESPSDIVFLQPQDPPLASVQWATGSRLHPEIAKSTQDWKATGDAHFKSKEYFSAAVAYSYALARDSTSISIRLNRALAHLRLRNFAAARKDAEAVLEQRNSNTTEKVKAKYRHAQAEYGLEEYSKARALYSECLDMDPSLKDAETGILNCERRLKEQTSGDYDWCALYKEGKAPAAESQVADFVGKIKIGQLEHRGGGRGIIATGEIEAGELLVRPSLSASTSLTNSNSR